MTLSSTTYWNSDELTSPDSKSAVAAILESAPQIDPAFNQQDQRGQQHASQQQQQQSSQQQPRTSQSRSRQPRQDQQQDIDDDQDPHENDDDQGPSVSPMSASSLTGNSGSQQSYGQMSNEDHHHHQQLHGMDLDVNGQEGHPHHSLLETSGPLAAHVVNINGGPVPGNGRISGGGGNGNNNGANSNGGLGGRPLSSSKRAEQNRKAQRAFRQRKEMYIKDLEAKVNELKTTKETIEALRQENIQLRDYILALQSRLIEHPGGVPTPPAVYARQGGGGGHANNGNGGGGGAGGGGGGGGGGGAPGNGGSNGGNNIGSVGSSGGNNGGGVGLHHELGRPRMHEEEEDDEDLRHGDESQHHHPSVAVAEAAAAAAAAVAAEQTGLYEQHYGHHSFHPQSLDSSKMK